MRQHGKILVLAVLLSAFATARAQQNPPQWGFADSYVAGTLVRADDGNFYRAIKVGSGHNPIVDAHIFWELYYVRTNVTLLIAKSGARFTSLRSAWNALQGAQITAAATVTLSIISNAGDYSESFPAALVLNHPQGSNIIIAGDDPNHVFLNFHTGGSAGLVVSEGHSFGGVFNLTLDGGGSSPGVAGLLVSGGCHLTANGVRILKFQTGIDVDKGSVVDAPFCTITFVGIQGILADNRSQVSCGSTTVDGGGNGSVGVQADHGSSIDASDTSLNHCALSGALATGGSTLNADGANASNCRDGFTADIHATIEAHNATATNNTIGFHAQRGAYIFASSVTTTGNVTDYMPPLNTAASDLAFISS